MRGEKNMKKLVPFIVTLLSLTGCSWSVSQNIESQSSNGQSSEAPLEAPSSSIPFSTFPISYPLEGQINKPNKQFNTKVENAVDADYVNALDQFALDFYGLLDNDENQVFSPLSIATCYSMLYEGCDGATRQELENMLHYDDSFNHLEEIQNMLLRCAINDTETGTYLDVSQSVWTRESGIFKQEYIDYLTNNYYAEAFNNINFATTGKQLCADWVNSKTNNFLNVQASDFESFNALTAMVLFNTIYLKSNWGVSDLFAEESNIQAEFTNRDNSKSTVTYMRGMNRDSTFYYTDKYTISSLPYCNGISLNILLPEEDYDNVLKDNGALNKLLNFNKLPSAETECEDAIWTLPKFKMQNKYGLIPLLSQLGLEETFSYNPNFDKMAEPEYKDELFIYESVHNAGIEVNNKGVEAAAYTYVQIDQKGSMPVRMTIDHPFAYAITTNDGYPLFMGIVNQL